MTSVVLLELKEFEWDGNLPSGDINLNFRLINQALGVLSGAATGEPGVSLPLAGGDMLGMLTLFGDPVGALDAATKQYADAIAAAAVLKSGGTMTGPLVLSGDPTQALNPATKAYADALGALKLSLTGGTLTGNVEVDANLYINKSYSLATGAGRSQSPFWIDSNVGGTITGGASLHAINIGSDRASATGAVSAFVVNHNVGGNGQSFGRQAIYSVMNVQAPVAGTNPQFVAAQFTAQAAASAGGTDPLTSPNGSIYGYSANARLVNGATNWYGLFGTEIDIYAQAGSSVANKAGITIIKLTSDAVQGSRNDSAIQISDQAATDWKAGIAFGRWDGAWPFGANSTIIGTWPQITNGGVATQFKPYKANIGIDWRTVQFSTSSLALPGFSVAPSGAVSVGPGKISTTTTTATLDVSGYCVSSAAVVGGGSGYFTNDVLTDGLGGQYTVTASSGVITALAVSVPPNVLAPPANPVTLTGGSGNSATANLTWVRATTLSLNPTGGQILLTNLPTSAIGLPAGSLWRNGNVVNIV